MSAANRRPEERGDRRSGVVLRPYTAEAVDAVQAMLDDPEVLRFTPIPEPLPPRHAERWLAIPSWIALLGPTVAGVGMSPVADPDTGEYELGYLVAQEHRRRGVATALLAGMTQWALADGARRITLHISAENAVSQHIARSAGYVLEGRLRSTFLKLGRREDTTVWSLLAADARPGPQ